MDNFTPDMSEQLVRLLDGELSSTDKAELEKRLASDKDLRDELESLEATREALRLFGLQQKISAIHGQMMEELRPPVKKISSVRRIARYGMIAAASLILIVGGVIAFNFYTLSADKVFSSRYQPYELNTVRGAGDTGISVMEQDYRGKKYANLVSIVYDRPFSIPESFLRAVSYMELKDDSSAIKEFKKIIAQNETANTNVMEDDAEYYLALTYIRHKEYDPALELLQKIKLDPGHLYHEKVTAKLLRQVKMLKRR